MEINYFLSNFQNYKLKAEFLGVFPWKYFPFFKGFIISFKFPWNVSMKLSIFQGLFSSFHTFYFSIVSQKKNHGKNPKCLFYSKDSIVFFQRPYLRQKNHGKSLKCFFYSKDSMVFSKVISFSCRV